MSQFFGLWKPFAIYKSGGQVKYCHSTLKMTQTDEKKKQQTMWLKFHNATTPINDVIIDTKCDTNTKKNNLTKLNRKKKQTINNTKGMSKWKTAKKKNSEGSWEEMRYPRVKCTNRREEKHLIFLISICTHIYCGLDINDPS